MLLRSADDGGRFQPVTAPPATAPTSRSSLGDIQNLQFVTANDGFATRGDRNVNIRSVVVTTNGGRSWRQARLPVQPANPPWAKGITVVGPTQATDGTVYEVAITCVTATDCPRYRLLTASGWFSPWHAATGPGIGTFNAAGGIGLSTYKTDVWLTVGNGEGQIRLLGSTDDGHHFETLDANLSEGSCSTQATSTRVVWLSCLGGMVVMFGRSSHGGKHFVRLPVSGSGTGGTALWPVTNSVVFFRTDVGQSVGQSAGLFRSTDNGRTFTKLHDLPQAFGPDGANLDTMTFSDAHRGLALTSDGDVFKTVDTGKRWVKLRVS